MPAIIETDQAYFKQQTCSTNAAFFDSPWKATYFCIVPFHRNVYCHIKPHQPEKWDIINNNEADKSVMSAHREQIRQGYTKCLLADLLASWKVGQSREEGEACLKTHLRDGRSMAERILVLKIIMQNVCIVVVCLPLGLFKNTNKICVLMLVFGHQKNKSSLKR